MKVYIISSGEYSDFRYHGVFSSEALAQEYIEKAKRAEEYWANGARVEEHEVDALKDT
jgi:hypothetical protein